MIIFWARFVLSTTVRTCERGSCLREGFYWRVLFARVYLGRPLFCMDGEGPAWPGTGCEERGRGDGAGGGEARCSIRAS